MGSLREMLDREYRANAAGAVCLFTGVVGVILGLEYVVLSAAAGCLLCRWWASGSTVAWIFGTIVEVAIAAALAWAVVFGLRYLSVTSQAGLYVQWEPIAQVAAAFLVWRLGSLLLSSMGWLDRYTATILGDSEWAADERRRIEGQFSAKVNR